jgi:hypothetical protein
MGRAENLAPATALSGWGFYRLNALTATIYQSWWGRRRKSGYVDQRLALS